MDIDIDEITVRLTREICFEKALAAFRRADVEASAATVRNIDFTSARFLYIRSLLRLRRYDEALQEVSDIPYVMGLSELAEQAILNALIHMELGDTKLAWSLAADALTYSGAWAPLEAEAFLTCARIAHREGDHLRANFCLERALSVRPVIAHLPEDRTIYALSFNSISVQALCLKARIAAVQGKRRDFVALLLRAEVLLKRQDAFETISMLMDYAHVMYDHGGHRAADGFFVEVDEINQAFDSDRSRLTRVASERSFISETAGWCKALHGDFVGARQAFAGIHRSAPLPIVQLAATLSILRLRRETEPNAMCDDLASRVESIAADIVWDKVAPHEHRLLLALAEERAYYFPAGARVALETYHRRRTSLERNEISMITKAWEAYIEGVVASANGFIERAIALQLEAYETFKTLHVEPRLALVARELCNLGLYARFSPVLDSELQKRPNSWFATLCRRAISLEGQV